MLYKLYMATLSKIMITMPDHLIEEIDRIAANRSEFIRNSVKDRLKRERQRLMVEGYSREKNLDEWESTAGDGLD